MTEGTAGLTGVLTASASDAVRLTFGALAHTAQELELHCGQVEQTLDRIAHTVGPLAEGPAHQDWGSYGLSTLPVAGALKAARSLISEYVRQHTGQPLEQWMAVVTDGQAQFSGFRGRLRQVVEIAQGPDDGVRDSDRARADLAHVEDVRRDAAAWRLLLGTIGRLTSVVETILQADLRSVLPPSPADSGDFAAGVLGGAFSRMKEAGARALDRTTDVREWMLRPLMDIRDGVSRLPAEVALLSQEVALLEILLEVQVAILRARTGGVASGEAGVLGRRVAALVRLPQLAAAVADAEARAETARTRGTRLRATRESGQVEEAVHRLLDAEYRADWERAGRDLARLAPELAAWRRDGPALLQACDDWVAFQLRLLTARSLVEQPGRPDPRERLLLREQQRLAEVRALLTALEGTPARATGEAAGGQGVSGDPWRPSPPSGA